MCSLPRVRPKTSVACDFTWTKTIATRKRPTARWGCKPHITTFTKWISFSVLRPNNAWLQHATDENVDLTRHSRRNLITCRRAEQNLLRWHIVVVIPRFTAG